MSITINIEYREPSYISRINDDFNKYNNKISKIVSENIEANYKAVENLLKMPYQE